MPEIRCTFAELEGHTIKKVRVAEVTRHPDDKRCVSEVYEFELEDGTKKYFGLDAGDLDDFYATAHPYQGAIPIPPIPKDTSGMEYTGDDFTLRGFSENLRQG